MFVEYFLKIFNIQSFCRELAEGTDNFVVRKGMGWIRQETTKQF